MSAPDQDDYVDDPTRGWRMDEDAPGEFASHSDVEIPEAES
jgi:hypothetical protein